jgi:hypothetical protein
MRAGVVQDGLVSPVLFSLYVNDIPTPSRHVELALYAKDKALVATSRTPSLLVGYLEAYLGRLEGGYGFGGLPSTSQRALLWSMLRRRDASKNPEQWSFSESQYSGVILDTQLTWSAHVNQVGKKGGSKTGRAWPLLNRRSGLSVRNGVLLYKLLIRPMMDYAYPIWRAAARSHVRKLQVLQSKCLHISTNAPWYVGNKQIHEDLGIPFFANLIRGLTFRLKASWCGEPLSSATWKAPVPIKGWLKSPTGYRGGLMFSKPAESVY